MTFSAELSKFPGLVHLIVKDVVEFVEKKGTSVNFNEIMSSNPERYKPLADLPKQDKSVLTVVGKLAESLVGILDGIEKLPEFKSTNVPKVISLIKASSPDLKRSTFLLSAVYRFVIDLSLKSKSKS